MDDVLVTYDGKHATSGREVTTLGEGNEPLGQGAQALGLGLRGGDATMFEEGGGQVGEHQALVRRSATQAGTLGWGRHVKTPCRGWLIG